MNKLLLILPSTVAALALAACGELTGPTIDASDPARPQFGITATSTTGFTIIDLESLGGSRASHAYAINDLGQVTGSSACCGPNQGGGTRAFLWTEMDGMTAVAAGSLIAWGFDISNRTHIVGRRFLFSPVGLFPFFWTERDGVIGFGAEGGEASGVNVLGHVAGRSGGGFFWSADGGLVPLPTGPDGLASDLNDLDVVVGTSGSGASSRPFYWTAEDGLVHIGTEWGRAQAINNRGQVVGQGPGLRSFIWDISSGSETMLDPLPGAVATFATDINDNGTVVGSSSSPQGQRAVVWSAEGDVIDLGTFPGHVRSQAHGINRRGDVVGTSWEQIGVGVYLPHAVLWKVH